LAENHPSAFWHWGNPAKAKALADFPALKAFLEARWQCELSPTFFPKPGDLPAIGPAKQQHFRQLFDRLADDQLSFDPLDRQKRAYGQGYHDLLKIHLNEKKALPAAVLYPHNHDEVGYILQQAGREGLRLYPSGGRTNVTGAFDIAAGSAPFACLDLTRMNRLIDIDRSSQLAIFQTGIFGPQLEDELNRQGFTLGHFPQSFQFSTLGGWLAMRSAGQESNFYGKIEDMVVRLKVASPQGTLATFPFPRHAIGVDLNQLFIGSEGTLGVITEACLAISRLPVRHQWVVALLPDFRSGNEVLRFLTQAAIHPSVIRYSDFHETRLLSMMSPSRGGAFAGLKRKLRNAYLKYKGLERPCLLMLRLEDLGAGLAGAHNFVKKQIQRQGGLAVSSSIGQNWEHGRFDLPYLRDSLIAQRVLIDTFETVTAWNQAEALYQAVHRTLETETDFFEKKGLLMCHVSHVYKTGVSLYFTALAKQQEGREMAQWQAIKSAISNAIVDNGGAISHHHGVGRDHQEWYFKHTDATTIELLKAVKKAVDPKGLLNPGLLFDRAKT